MNTVSARGIHACQQGKAGGSANEVDGVETAGVDTKVIVLVVLT